MNLRPLLLLLLVAPIAVRAAGPLVDPSPLVPAGGPAAPGGGLVSLDRARSALAMGFPSIAAGQLEQLLASPDTAGTDPNALVLDLVSARLDDGDPAAAGVALKRYLGVPTAAYQLRAGLVAALLARPVEARPAFAAIRPEELTADDRSWYYFLQGMLADAAGDFAGSGTAYQRAAESAVSDLQKSSFLLAQSMAQLITSRRITEAQAASLKDNADRNFGRGVGYGFAHSYAVAEAALGHTPEAVAYLQQQLRALPTAEHAPSDDFRFLLGQIEGAAPGGAGRNALEGLLTDGTDRNRQRMALQLLARGSTAGAVREEFHAKLTELIKLQPPHPLLEDLLLFRAQLALADKHYTGDPDKDPGAEEDAARLLASFPGSQLKPEALGVLTGAAWELGLYRTAANAAAQTRAALPPGDRRAASLGVLVAEAYFRTGDFQSAADAYAAALNSPPDGVPPGGLIFQQMMAELKTGRTDDAGRLLDRFADDPRLDPVNRWQAEWNLARALQATGATAAAKTRVDRLLGPPAEAVPDRAALPADLRVRMQWLQARLALDSGAAALVEPALAQNFLQEARTLAQALLGLLADPAGLGDDFRQEVTAETLLLRAETEFKLGLETDALATLKQLRTDLPATDAALHSYLDEADHLENKADYVGAENVLKTLAEGFKASRVAPGGPPRGAAKRVEQENNYAPYALYRAALNEERRGPEFYKAANDTLNTLVTTYKHHDLVFYAQLKQGDLLRRLNQFGAAQQIYENLVNNFTANADWLKADLALAACHRAQAQAATNDSHYKSALEIFEQLHYLANAPPDLRAEAGFQYGDLLAQHGQNGLAETAWMSMVTTFLHDDATAGKLGATGRAWLARALLHAGDLLAVEHKFEEARNAYQLLISTGLPFQAVANDSLKRLGGGPAP